MIAVTIRPPVGSIDTLRNLINEVYPFIISPSFSGRVHIITLQWANGSVSVNGHSLSMEGHLLDTTNRFLSLRGPSSNQLSIDDVYLSGSSSPSVRVILDPSPIGGSVASGGIEPLAPTAIDGIRVSVEPEGLAGFADDATIDVWADESGHSPANDFIQVTEANKPICKTNILNGFRVARFDGVSDRITTQYGPKDDLADGFTFAAVFRTTTTATRQIILWTGDSNSTGFAPSNFASSTFSITDDGVADLVGNLMVNTAGADIKSYSPLTDTANFHIGICTFSGFGTNPGNKTVQMFLDGTFASSDTESFSEDYTQYVALTRMATPGNLATNFFNGDIAAAAIFARALSESEITGLYLFWRNKYNL